MRPRCSGASTPSLRESREHCRDRGGHARRGPFGVTVGPIGVAALGTAFSETETGRHRFRGTHGPLVSADLAGLCVGFPPTASSVQFRPGNRPSRQDFWPGRDGSANGEFSGKRRPFPGGGGREQFASDHAALKPAAFPEDAVSLGRVVWTARALVWALGGATRGLISQESSQPRSVSVSVSWPQVVEHRPRRDRTTGRAIGSFVLPLAGSGCQRHRGLVQEQ